MSGVLGTVGKIAGVVSAVAMFIPGGQPIAAAAALVATAASVGAQITAVPPPRQGSVSQTTIGTDQDSPWIVGRTYYGGARVQLVGYGATLKKVKNPYLLAADVHSVGGPVDGLEGIYADLAPVAMRAEGPVAGTNSYFYEHLWRSFQLGQQTEATALPLRFPGAPGWAGDARLSGKAAIAYNALFDRDGEVFASGFAQMGAVWRGARCWNPVEDSTYPGGVGASRWASPADTAGHDAARATWSFTRSPGLLALRYALGIYERDTRTASVYRKTFGAGIPIDGLIVDQFVHLHNVCAANNWNCDGVLLEPSSSKWDNLKRILAAGGAEPCWIGGRLGVRVNAPRIALDTITASDLAEGEIVVGAVQGWEQRLNTIVPKYRSETHRWEYVATDPVQIATYLAEDGEEKREERQYDLVQDPTQARQLAAYELLDRRELGEIELPCKPRLRRYGPGDLLYVNIPDAGLVNQPAVVMRRTLDPATMGVTLVLRGETLAKHDFALGRTGTPPPTPALVATPSLDEIALERPVSWDTISDPTGTKPEDNATVGAPEGTDIGGRPVADVLAAFDAAQAQQNHFETVVIPAVDAAVADAVKRVDDAASTITNFEQRVTTVESSSASGGNLLSNTDWAVDASGWAFQSESFSQGYLAAYGPENYWPIGMKALQIYSPTGSGDRAGYWYQAVRGIEGGGSYQASLYVASHRAVAGIYIDTYTADGIYNGGHFELATDKFNGGTRNLTDDYGRVVINFEVPANTAFLIFYIMKYGTAAGEADSYSWFLRPQLTKVRKGVTEPVPYTPGSADAGAAALNARVSTVEKAGNDGRLALASRATTLEAAAIAARAGSLVANATFAFWSDPAATPNNWGTWNQPFQMERVASNTSSAGWVLRGTAAKGLDTGLWQTPCKFEPGWFVMEIDAELRDGTWEGLGVTVEGYFSLDASREPDTNDVISPYGYKRRRWSKLFYCDRALNNWHLMMNWGPFAPMEYKQVDWFHCDVRPASAQEIASRKAIDVTIPAVTARVKSTEDALASLPDLYATAARAAQLEAQVNFAADSGLKRTLSAQIEDRATAIADAKAGVVATSVQTLRTDFDGRIGQVEQKAGAITDIDGRTSVYWQVTGTTNDGATMIQLTKKDGSSPLFYIGANTLIDGNLMVTGTVNSRVIQNGAVTNSVTTTGGAYGFQQNTQQVTGEAYLNVSGTGFVRVDVRLTTNVADGEGSMTAPNQWFLALYRDQGGQQKFIGSTQFRETQMFTFWDIDIPQAAGLCRYYVVLTLSLAQRPGNVSNTKINATEYKK